MFEQEETPCPNRADKTHCVCWWEGKPCCSCGAGSTLKERIKTWIEYVWQEIRWIYYRSKK